MQAIAMLRYERFLLRDPAIRFPPLARLFVGSFFTPFEIMSVVNSRIIAVSASDMALVEYDGGSCGRDSVGDHFFITPFGLLRGDFSLARKKCIYMDGATPVNGTKFTLSAGSISASISMESLNNSDTKLFG